MKKLSILMLILGMVSVANATMTFEFRDAAGTTVITEIAEGGSGTFFVMGQVADAGWAEGVYTSDGTDGGGKLDIDGVTSYAAAGDLSSANYYASYDGADCTSGDINSDIAPNPADGDWFKLDWSLNPSAVNGDTITIEVQDMDYGYAWLNSYNLPVVPEPMTIALLGLGGLLLRRRK